MLEIYDDIWNYWEPGKTLLTITTNGHVNAEGKCTMGRGTAEQAAGRFPELQRQLGALLRDRKNGGNRVYKWEDYGILTVPVKDHWKNPAYLPRILHSVDQMLDLLEGDDRPVYAVRFGCGNGGLDWDYEVRPAIAPLLDHRFTIVEGAPASRVIAPPQGLVLPFEPERAGRIIIAGSRYINYLTVAEMDAIVRESGFTIVQLVSGEDGYENSPDMLGIAWADWAGTPYKPFPAAWDDLTHPGRRIRYRQGRPYDANAGFRRNQEMVDYAGGLIVLYDGESRGAADMIRRAMAAGLPVFRKNLPSRKPRWAK